MSIPFRCLAAGTTGGGGTTTQAGTLAPTITKSTLTASQVSGVKQNGAVQVLVTNTGSVLNKGKDTITLYASTDGTIDSSSTKILAISKTLSLKSKASTKLSFSIHNLILPAGSYGLIAQVTDSTGTLTESPEYSTITVAAPFVSLAGTLSAIAPTDPKPGKTVSLTLTLTNTGNIDASGAATFAIGVSTDGSTVNESITTISHPVKLKTGGKPTAVHLHFKLPTDLLAISYDPIVTMIQGLSSLTIVGSPFTPVTG
jgi:hypothetical protein